MGQNDDKYKPQLVMYKDLSEDLPPLSITEGYTLKCYNSPEDGEAWSDIMENAFGFRFEFDKVLKPAKEFKPERVLFICHNNVPVATAAAWYNEDWGDETGYVHMVGVLSDHSNRGLGYQVSLAAIMQMKKEGRKYAVLETNDYRLGALSIYLKLGFKPVLIHENQRERWVEIFNTLNKPHLADMYKDILSGSLFNGPTVNPFAKKQQTENGQ